MQDPLGKRNVKQVNNLGRSRNDSMNRSAFLFVLKTIVYLSPLFAC